MENDKFYREMRRILKQTNIDKKESLKNTFFFLDIFFIYSAFTIKNFNYEFLCILINLP